MGRTGTVALRGQTNLENLPLDSPISQKQNVDC